MLHAPDAFVEVCDGPGGELLRESANVGPFAGAGLGVDFGGCFAHGGEGFGGEEGGDHDEAVFVEAVQEGVGGVGWGRHFEGGGGGPGGDSGDNGSFARIWSWVRTE